jgi:hypothetical protein
MITLIRAATIPTPIPTTVSIKRRMGCFHACCGLMPATTITTAIVIPAVMMSSGLPSRVKTIAPIPISAAMPQADNGKINRYTRQRTKLSNVAAIRDKAALRLCW